jgi:hypothetical protein
VFDYAGSYHLETENDKTTMPWLYKTMMVRLKCSNDNKMNSNLGGGTRWWGFVDFLSGREPLSKPRRNALYFKSGSPECEERDIGFSVESMVDEVVVFRKMITDIDIRDWHNYTIIWERGNATFMVDGKVVANVEGQGMVPDDPMPIYIQIGNIIYCGEPWDAFVSVNQSLEVDYLHLFYSDEEVYRNESEIITELFVNASHVIEEVESRGYDVQEQRNLYSMAENNWTNYKIYLAIQSLEAIISSAERYEVADEIAREELFRLARKAIDKAEGKGMDVRVLRAQYTTAEKCWEREDFDCSKMYLERIIDSLTN